MRNITGQAVVGDDLYGREYELSRLWEHLTQGEHVLMLAPRRVGKTSLMLELRRAPRENWDVVSVIRDLEADGYLDRDENRLEFRSNLLREWWRKRYGRGATP